VGNSIHTMSLRDLKQLEGRLEKGINKIRARKVYDISMELLQYTHSTSTIFWNIEI
jgi:hypothetical protein